MSLVRKTNDQPNEINCVLKIRILVESIKKLASTSGEGKRGKLLVTPKHLESIFRSGKEIHPAFRL
jgi:hypothetical protein